MAPRREPAGKVGVGGCNPPIANRTKDLFGDDRNAKGMRGVFHFAVAAQRGERWPRPHGEVIDLHGLNRLTRLDRFCHGTGGDNTL